MSDPQKSEKPRGRFKLRALGFSAFERKALAFLILVIVIGSAARYWQNNTLNRTLQVIVENSDPAHSEPDADQLLVGSRTPLNLNTVGLSGLESLPGIGPIRAQAIVDYRESHGPFKSVDDLQNVYGIGAKTVARLRDHVFLGEKP